MIYLSEQKEVGNFITTILSMATNIKEMDTGIQTQILYHWAIP